MQPIVLLALVGVGAAALGTGFLANQDQIMVNLQGLGVGTELIEAPISDAWVDLSVTAMLGQVGEKTVFKNIVNKCSFHYTDEIDRVGLETNARVICKISDKDGDIVAEGFRQGNFDTSVTYQIPIDQFVSDDGFIRVEDVHDVMIVALSSFTHPENTNVLP